MTMTIQYEKPFLVNIEGPDDIEEFDTMRGAVQRANEINSDLVETVSRGGEQAPHLWAVPWRTETYLAQFRDAESRQISSVLALGLPGTDLYDRIKEQADVGADETLGKWAYRSRLMVIAELLNAAPEPQGTDEDDQEYVARMKREWPDLSLDDLGFVDGQEPQGEPSDARHVAHVTVEWAYESDCLEGECVHRDEDGEPEDMSVCPNVPPFEVCVGCMEDEGRGSDPEQWYDVPLMPWPCPAALRAAGEVDR